MHAVYRNVKNNMYAIVIAAVEAETKESWTWLLETLVSDLEAHEWCARPTLISDRQKVSSITYKFYIPFSNYLMVACILVCFCRVCSRF